MSAAGLSASIACHGKRQGSDASQTLMIISRRPPGCGSSSRNSASFFHREAPAPETLGERPRWKVESCIGLID